MNKRNLTYDLYRAIIFFFSDLICLKLHPSVETVKIIVFVSIFQG